jgi:hypothetical protein
MTNAVAGGMDLFCRRHWRGLPEDLRDRLRWAVRESDDEMDVLAALESAYEYEDDPSGP